MTNETRTIMVQYIHRNFDKFISPSSPMYWDKDFYEIFADDILDEVETIITDTLYGKTKYETIGEIVDEYLHLPKYYAWLFIADEQYMTEEDRTIYDWLNRKLTNL